MKAIEEMKSSVLAYCEEVCPQSTKGFWHSISASIKLLHHPSESHRWSLDFFDGDGSNEWLCVLCWIGEDSNEEEIRTAYRILGLEARDAVAAEKRETERVRTSLNHAIALKNEQIQKRLIESNADRNDLEAIIDHERARNTALVEALEEIRKPAMIISLGKATNRDRAEQLTEDHKRVRMIATKAIIANTEKGGVND